MFTACGIMHRRCCRLVTSITAVKFQEHPTSVLKVISGNQVATDTLMKVLYSVSSIM